MVFPVTLLQPDGAASPFKLGLGNDVAGNSFNLGGCEVFTEGWHGIFPTCDLSLDGCN